MSIEQKLRNLGIDPDLPEEEIQKRLEKLMEKQRAEEAKAIEELKKEQNR